LTAARSESLAIHADAELARPLLKMFSMSDLFSKLGMLRYAANDATGG
jgi:hypothetical protein